MGAGRTNVLLWKSMLYTVHQREICSINSDRELFDALMQIIGETMDFWVVRLATEESNRLVSNRHNTDAVMMFCAFH